MPTRDLQDHIEGSVILRVAEERLKIQIDYQLKKGNLIIFITKYYWQI